MEINLFIWIKSIIFVNYINNFKVYDMKQIELQILASDVHETRYVNAGDCVITRALQRAGLPYEDGGTGISEIGSIEELAIDQGQYKDLVKKVMGMYSTKDDNPYFITGAYGSNIEIDRIPIEDFVHTITFYDLE